MEPRLEEWKRRKEQSERVKTKKKKNECEGKEEGGSVRRDGENWAMQEKEWGNIFHFPFPSSPCQDINRYPLKPVPSLCRGIGGKWRRAVYC